MLAKGVPHPVRPQSQSPTPAPAPAVAACRKCGVPGLAVEKLHPNERLTVVFADFVDGANIWMVQGGSSLCLTVEAAQCL